MTLLQIFSDKRWLELAVALSALPPGAHAEALARAGVPASEHEAFLGAVGAFIALRDDVNCVECARPESCLDDNTLAEFVDGVLQREALHAVERQLAVCGGCLRKAVDLADLTRELAPAPHWTGVVLGLAERGLRVLSKPLESIRFEALVPVAALAGATAAPQAQRWMVAHGSINATFTMTAESNGCVSLHARFERDGRPLSPARLGLRLDDLLLEAHPLPDSGEATLWHLAPGRYQVEIESAGEAAFFALELQQIQ